jgi:hypothetical protein
MLGWILNIGFSYALFVAIRNLVKDISPLKPTLRWLFILCCLNMILVIVIILYLGNSYGLQTIAENYDSIPEFDQALLNILFLNSLPAIFSIRVTYSYFGIEIPVR